MKNPVLRLLTFWSDSIFLNDSLDANWLSEFLARLRTLNQSPRAFTVQS